MKFQIITTVCLYSVAITHAARILAIFPMNGRSHFEFNNAVVDSLYRAGHQITFISPFASAISMPNATIINSKNEYSVTHISRATIFTYNELSIKEHVEFWRQEGVTLCHDVLNLRELQQINGKEKSYDVMFIQLLSMYHCFVPLAQKLDIPVIGTSAAGVWRKADLAVGNPFNPAALRFEHSELSHLRTTFDRLHNLWSMLQMDFFSYLLEPPAIEKLRRQYYGADFQRNKDISLTFINNHASYYPRPSVPNAIEIGGIHVKPAVELPQDIKKFLDDAEYGVIVFSLGSVTRGSTMTAKMRDAFKDAFAQIPQRVIWKFEDSMENVPSNVLPLKWFPQRDVLAHRNIKAFMSHCGMSGTYEAIHEAVPTIMIPLFSDQRSNAASLAGSGVGVYLDLFTVTSDKVLNALHTVINDTSYKLKMQQLSQRFKDRPMSPAESVVYWTEYVIRHKGATHLKTSGADMPLYQYLMLDVLAFISVILVCSFCALFWVMKACYSFIRAFSKTTKFIDVQKNKKTK